MQEESPRTLQSGIYKDLRYMWQTYVDIFHLKNRGNSIPRKKGSYNCCKPVKDPIAAGSVPEIEPACNNLKVDKIQQGQYLSKKIYSAQNL